MFGYLSVFIFNRPEKAFSRICFLLFLSGLFFVLPPAAGAQRAGGLDEGFGQNGKVFTNFTNFNTGVGEFVAVQPDGKVLLAGYVQRNLFDGYLTDFAVVRFNEDGTLDDTFGTGGKVTTDRSPSDYVKAIAVQPDGKIVIGGYSFLGSASNQFVLVRYNPNGTLDASFNNSGFASAGFDEPPSSSSDILTNIAIQPDGKIVAVGSADRYQTPYDFGIMRFNANGMLDTSFDGDGKALISTHPLSDIALAVSIQTDGKIVIIGSSAPGGLGVVRLNTDGSLDTSYDEDGIALIGIPGMLIAPRRGTIQPDNKVLVAFTNTVSGTGGSDGRFSVIRLKTNGSLDESFDADGFVVTQFENAHAAAYDVAAQPDGKIVAGGGVVNPNQTENLDFGLVRYNPDGTVDYTFGTNGRVRTDLGDGSWDLASSLAIQADGKIVLGGRSSAGSYVAARYNGIYHQIYPPFDYDGDGKADISVFRPTAGEWYILRSFDSYSIGIGFGLPNDLIAPADFDGDGKTDICVFRPSTGSWYRLNSASGTFSALEFGAGGDLPVPGDFDGDGRADIAVYRPSAGSWYRINSSNNQSVGAQFGIAEDKPIVGDFDGDAKADLAVFRPSSGTWYRINSSDNQFFAAQFGIAEDKPVAADYDGDGKTDLAVYRPSAGSWYRIHSLDGSFAATQFGIAEDKPAPADFDGDDKVDLAVFRPSTGTWYLLRSTQGFTGAQYGTSGDVPTPGAFVR